MAVKKSIWILFGVLVISALVLGSAIQAVAQTKTMKYRVSSYVVQNEVLPVGDQEGHFVSIFSRRGLSYFENGEIATFTNWGTSDTIKGKGPSQGYALFTFEDGSTIVGNFKCESEPAPKGLSSIKCAGDYTKGSGRFEGIKGTYSIAGRTLTTFSKETKGDLYYDVIGTYTLPSK
jgi:hypothetical protein